MSAPTWWCVFLAGGDIVPSFVCYYCFSRHSPGDLLFRCPKDHAAFGQKGPVALQSPWTFFRPPREVICPFDGVRVRHRFCANPNCNQELPQYIGQVRQRIIAITGCRDSGKTIYHGCLLHQLRDICSRDDHPFAVAMFEDDRSADEYHRFYETVLERGEFPETTQPKPGDAYTPIIVRVIQKGVSSSHTNLIFYDLSGELFQSLENERYLRYLAHAAGLIYLVDLTDEQDRAHLGLNAILDSFRKSGIRTPIDKPLAIALNKADISLFSDLSLQDDPDSVLPGYSPGSRFWHRWGMRERQALARTSAACEEYARARGLDDLYALAETNFCNFRTFAVSSLGHQPSGGRIGKVQPMGVENPLFWILRSLG